MQATTGEFSKYHDWRGFSGLFIGLGMVALLALTIVVLGNANENSFRRLDHTRDVIGITQRLLSSAALVDAGVRGFVATGDSAFIQSDDLRELRSLVEELQRQTADNPKQQETINHRLLPAVRRIELTTEALIKERRAGVKDLVTEKQLMGELRNTTAYIEQDENRLLKERTEDFRQIANTVWIVRFVLLAMAIAAVAIGLFGLQKLVTRERAQIQSLEKANKTLEIETAERRRAEQDAIAANEAKTQFVASVSHEIRTPLSGVIGMAELLLDSPELTEDSRDLAERLHRASNQMLDVLNEILDFSKLEAGRMQLDVREFTVRTVLDDVIGLSKFKADEKGIELKGKIEEEVPQTMIGDEAKIRQVLLNFVHNAIKFTHEGSVTVRIHPDGPDYVKFRVKDTGIGLSTTSQQRLFKPYAQADKSTGKRFGGTGLGLAISKKYVELMGGSIGLQSEPGKGTDIWFSIPKDLSSNE